MANLPAAMVVELVVDGILFKAAQRAYRSGAPCFEILDEMRYDENELNAIDKVELLEAEAEIPSLTPMTFEEVVAMFFAD